MRVLSTPLFFQNISLWCSFTSRIHKI